MLIYMEIMPRRFKSNDKNDLNSLLIIEKYNEIMFPVTDEIRNVVTIIVIEKKIMVIALQVTRYFPTLIYITYRYTRARICICIVTPYRELFCNEKEEKIFLCEIEHR